MQKQKRQDGYLNDTDKERMEELQRKYLPEKNRDEPTIIGQLTTMYYARCYAFLFVIKR